MFSILGEFNFPLWLVLAMSQLDPLGEELGREYYERCKPGRYSLKASRITKDPGTKMQRKILT